jgi:hypothetical protein
MTVFLLIGLICCVIIYVSIISIKVDIAVGHYEWNPEMSDSSFDKGNLKTEEGAE